MKEVKSNVTGTGSDALDSWARHLKDHDLANEQPLRLGLLAGQ